jgi:hypothetical protein
MLTRLTKDLFAQLEAQWKAECERLGESYDEYAAPSIDHARNISAEDPADKKYGIFALKEDEEYVGILHANWARLPRTDGKTVRVLWVLLSPKFDFEDVKAHDVAKVTAQLILGALGLAKAEMASRNIKLHIGNMLDRQYVTGIAAGLTGQGVFASAEVRGNWLEIVL